MPESAHCFGNRLWANVVPTRSYHDAPSRQGGLEGNWCLIAVAVDSEEKIMTCVITILHVNKERVFDSLDDHQSPYGYTTARRMLTSVPSQQMPSSRLHFIH
ncbi:MAG: hypothetical protein HW412_657 [Bacteroidetes bacterium]|nr:hypothetical protein [Bacteroidota bacterium]